jgi:AAA+ ATPase superfamily predicted ATPase
MKNILIGRAKEQATLRKAYESNESEMVAVFGRRRVGKTFLVRSVFEERINLEFTGVQNASLEEQLTTFLFHIQRYSKLGAKLNKSRTWLAAFLQLITVLEEEKTDKKRIIFFDELPWLATHRSGFLKAFGFFWNNWASKNNMLLIICGSAASWMIQKIIKDKGGLHNRITRRIYLKPFDLSETTAFLKSKQVRLNHYHTLLIYMIMGGIPHYLKELEQGKSAIQNINDICFSEEGLLFDEFNNLYAALFKNSESHISIVRALATKRKGLTRNEIIKQSKLSDGGGMTQTLNSLIHSGFVSSYFPFGKKRKTILYRLTDEYSLFYLQFIETNRRNVKGAWQALSQTAVFKSWSGYAFESVCLKHIEQIKNALQIGGIYSEHSGFVFQGNEYLPGIQIDLLIDRNDQVINICEMKFYQKEFTISKSYAEQLRRKISIFSEATQTKKQIFLTMITTFGLLENKHSQGLIDNQLIMDVLFE